MAQGLFMSGRRRPTIGALYVAAVGVLAVLMLLLVTTGLASPIAVGLVAVPLGPIGIVAAVLALPVFSAVPSAALAVLILASALAIAAVNVMLAATASWAARARLDGIREQILVR